MLQEAREKFSTRMHIEEFVNRLNVIVNRKPADAQAQRNSFFGESFEDEAKHSLLLLRQFGHIGQDHRLVANGGIYFGITVPIRWNGCELKWHCAKANMLAGGHE
jgi:hypothetical protein